MKKLSVKPPNILSLCYIGSSLFGLCLLAILTFSIPVDMINFPWRKQLTGSIFAAICLLGITAAISPSRCSRILHFRGRNRNSHRRERTNSGVTTIKFEGHHPPCGNFSSHVLQLGGKTYCAGCTGLATGAVMSLLGSLLYFAGFHVGELSIPVFWVGFVGVTCGLLQYHIFDVNRGAVHYFLNVLFVLGAFLLLIGVNEIDSNFVLDLYLLTLIVYWIITRILLSQLEHKKICVTCGLESCSFL